MINDSERREIAARLREQKTWDIFTDFEDCIGDLCDAVFEDEGDLNDIFRLQAYLAELIEPEPERTCKTTCRNVSEYQDVFACSECRCKVEIIGKECNEYGECFCAPFMPSFCPSCGAEVVG